jgi:hypothetical protein
MAVDRPHSRAKYVAEGCRCAVCTEDNRLKMAAWRRAKAYGQVSYVDAGAARAHVHLLQDSGLGWKRIATLAGVSTGALSRLIYGGPGQVPSPRIKPETERKILAVQPAAHLLGGGVKQDATGTRRRLQALVAMGWSQSKLGYRLGVLPSNFTALLDRDQVLVSTARAVAELYDQLWSTLPPNATWHERSSVTRAKRHAAAHGWVPPLGWDDETIDDPQALPTGEQDDDELVDEVAVERVLAGHAAAGSLTKAERLEAARRIVAGGGAVSQISKLLRTNAYAARKLFAEAQGGMA